MKKIIGIALLALGVVLLVNGWQAHNSVESKLGRALRGSSSKPAILLLSTGAACAAAGVGMILFSKK